MNENIKNDHLGVHTAAERGQGRAVFTHLQKLNLNISENQRARLVRLQKARDVQRKYRMSKVSYLATIVHYSLDFIQIVVSELISQSIIRDVRVSLKVIKLRRRGVAQKKASMSLDVGNDGYAKSQYLQEVPVAGMLISHFLARACYFKGGPK